MTIDNKDLYNMNSWQDKTILIAEDIDINYKFIEVIVLKTKAKIIRAKNGQEAIDLVNSNPQIDLVLMDIMMPDIDGFQATAEIKKTRINLPVIAQTAYGDEINQAQLNKAGFDGFISKPIKLEELISILRKFFK